MSWDGYIDNIIGRSKGSCDKVGLIGLDGGAAWTTDAGGKGVVLNAGEGAKIASAMKSGSFESFQAGGILVTGVKYQYLRQMDDKIVLGKKKDHGSITIQKTKTAVIIAHTKEGGQQADTNLATDGIGDYLEQNNM